MPRTEPPADSIRARIRRSALLMLALVGLAAAYGWWSMDRLARSVRATLARVRTESALTARFSSTIAQELHAAASHLVQGDAQSSADFTRLRSATREIYSRLDRDVDQSVEEARLIAEIERELALIEVAYATAHRQADLGRAAAAREEARRVGPLVRDMLRDVERFEGLQERRVAELSQRLLAYGRTQAALLAALLGAGVLAAALLARRAERTISRPLEALAAQADALSRGELGVRTPESPALPAEVRVLAAAMNHAGASLQKLADAEALLRQSERMAALGRVTAGIAHEINSPLGGVLGALQLARELAAEQASAAGNAPADVEARHAVAREMGEVLLAAEDATKKLARFVRTLREETRAAGDDAPAGAFDASAEVEAVVSQLAGEMKGRGARIHAEVEPGVRIAGRAEKLATVLRNLVSNAADAYDGGGGDVWVRLHRRDAAAVLEVEDRGSGIPEGARGRVFDYMFTTKDVGRGTGLGLSLVHSIVTTHFRGEIGFRTEPGRGTTFAATLPLAPR